MPNRRPSQNGESTGGVAGEPISQQERIEFLAHVPLFSELNRRELRTLAQAAIQREYSDGVTIVQQGETGVGLYVIIRGRVLVRQRQADGAERQLAALGSGEMFGEMALLDTFPRSASVVAEEATSALVIPIFDFRALLRDDSPIAIKLLAVLSRRVRHVELVVG
jgi:CRP/FNR family transcriptional regulator, cyclic AMP receptor protein